MSSVGWVYDPAKFPYTARNLSINVVRHAISVDERRWFFRQNRMYQTGAQDLKECWFQGFIRTSEAVIARANGAKLRAIWVVSRPRSSLRKRVRRDALLTAADEPAV